MGRATGCRSVAPASATPQNLSYSDREGRLCFNRLVNADLTRKLGYDGSVKDISLWRVANLRDLQHLARTLLSGDVASALTATSWFLQGTRHHCGVAAEHSLRGQQ
jgi:hypothetical protein